MSNAGAAKRGGLSVAPLESIRGCGHRVKLNGKEYVPPPASDGGNRHDSILLRMQLSASDAPAPPHVRLVMLTPVTSPLPVREMATVTVCRGALVGAVLLRGTAAARQRADYGCR